jgi:hypothetical protein
MALCAGRLEKGTESTGDRNGPRTVMREGAGFAGDSETIRIGRIFHAGI